MVLEEFESLGDVVRRRAQDAPDRPAYIFLGDGEVEVERWTYGEIDRRARAIAAKLLQMDGLGERALLLYPPGLEFVAAFLGCLYAGVVAIPAYPPRRRRIQPRLLSILEDSRPSFVLVTADLRRHADALASQSPRLADVRWLETDTLEGELADDWQRPSKTQVHRQSLAFLQYTSGSTGNPKGVMVSHGNLLHNESVIQRAFGLTEDSVVVGWLPSYHDMGLIGNILQPVYSGGQCVMMSPMAFLQKPLRWLQAIDRYGGTCSGGPNFAYELCVERISDEDRRGLDLSRWTLAFSGAEPVRAGTLDRFAKAFQANGFRREAFYPCYGLAEGTLFVTGGETAKPPVVESFDPQALEQHAVQDLASDEGGRPLVGCGTAPADQEVAIVDPETLEHCDGSKVGEIWVRGPSIAQGYWHKPEATRQDFQALPAGESGEPFLRTGDLGFLRDGELFIAGRAKELIILRGRNLYPQDLELTAESSHPALRTGCSAAFAVDDEAGERLVLVMEARRDARLGSNPERVEEVAAAVRQAVAAEHEARVDAVVLIRTGTLLKTSSGKIQRRACRTAYLDGELSVVGESRLSDAPVTAVVEVEPSEEAVGETEGGKTENGAAEDSLDRARLLAAPAGERRDLLLGALRDMLSTRLGLAPARLVDDAPLTSLGLDSLAAMETSGRLEQDLGHSLDVAMLLDGASLAEVVDGVLETLDPNAGDDGSTPSETIPKVGPTEGVHPLSFGQEALWFLHRLAPQSTAYNIPAAARIRGALDVDILREAFAALLDRHPVLRTRFCFPEEREAESMGLGAVENPVQEVLPATPERLDFAVLDLDGEGPGALQAGDLQARLADEAHRPFDLAQEPLMRVRVYRQGGQEHILLLVVHHIAADFWSLSVLLEELGELYDAARQGRAATLSPLPIRYTDHVRWLRERLGGPEGERLRDHWLQTLDGELDPLELPIDLHRPPVQTWEGSSVSLDLPVATADRLRQMARDSGATLYMVLLAAYQTLLHRYTGQGQILVGSPTSGRQRQEVKGLVGYFVNPVVMRGDSGGDPTWQTFLARTQRGTLDAFRHQDYPFDLLVEHLHPRRGVSRSPIFQVLFTLQQAPRLRDSGLDALALGRSGTRVSLAGLEWESFQLEERAAQFDLSLAVADDGEGLHLTLQFNTDLFEATTARRQLGHLQTLLESVVDTPEAPLSTLPLMAAGERHQVLAAWNATTVEYPRHLGLHELVKLQVQRTPDAVALEMVPFEPSASSAEGSLTYGELWSRATHLASHLLDLGVTRGTHLGLATERSPEMVVGLLGILLAGGTYVPLDPAYPEERLTYMLESACRGQAERLLLTRRADRQGLGTLLDLATTVVEIDTVLETPGEVAPEFPAVDPTALAYTIYTSGSTGKPKGVEISHRAAVNFLDSMARQPGLEASDRLLAVTTLAFDIAVLELFLPLTVGATILLAERQVATDALRLGQALDEYRATVMQATPATWRLLEESGWRGRQGLTLLSGGEALPVDLAAKLLSRELRGNDDALWNMYGPTETTVWSAARRVAVGEEPIRVGGLLGNTRIHILDSHLEPLPVGVPGEVWIGGDGLARGYRGRPALTAERFVPDPFAAELDAPAGGRLYRVGDLARWRSDGDLEFFGRVDHQVKVRGYRIELGEIETELLEHPGVRQGVVIVRLDDPTDPVLAAYFVPEGDEAPSRSTLRTFLRRSLPNYMVPTLFVALDELPLTDNGKVSRKALARLEPPQRASVAPRVPQGELETTIATAWCEILGVESVGLDDNFFDLGGHSLRATRLHRLLVDRLDRPDLTVVHLFQYPTVGSLARFLAPAESQRTSGRGERSPAAMGRSAPGSMDVAVVGMAGRFPGAPDVETFWENLRGGVESITFFSEDELTDRVDPKLLTDSRYVRARGLLDGFDTFDAGFFGITPREAEVMDPQHRLFLECTFEALEHAGYDSRLYDGRIGLFAGVGMNTYLLHAGEERLAASVGSYQAFISNDKDFVPTRVSYKLDLRGPSVNVQTACSSSLVAVHLACQSLFQGESDMAMAGGVTVRVPQQQGYVYEAGGILSPDGHCRAFDANAGGTVLGNGLGVVVLKPLARALEDNDQVLAVIKGSAINNDGALKIGYTAPSVEGQAEVIQTAQTVAGVDPRTLGYVEAHGTGTSLGDPIEVAALTQAFTAGANGSGSDGTDAARGYCALGSVKTNIGHLDTGAGVAGLIKTILALRHREIPPSLHFTEPNPAIPLAESPFFVNDRLRPWGAEEHPRRAGVSSFGIGGTNAHVVLEEAPQPAPTSVSRPWQILLLSARSSTALDRATERLVHRLRDGELDVADVAYTLQVGRRSHEYRRWAVVDSAETALRVLDTLDPEWVKEGRAKSGEAKATNRVSFLFSGQGAQYVEMGRQLYDTEPVFRAEIDRCSERLQEWIDLDLRHVLYPSLFPGVDAEWAAERLRETRYTQPALFVFEYALARLWMAWGVTPAAMLGHSIGEYVAATLSGVFHFDDALELVALRGRLMQEQPPGAMMAVHGTEADLQGQLPEGLTLAAINGPSDCVVAGPEGPMAAFEAKLAEDGVRHRRLHTSHAFHSAMMHPAVEPFVEKVASLRLATPSLPFVSNVSGTWITDAEATDPDYWGRHLAQPVRFADGLGALAEEPGLFLEVGPGHTLATLGRSQARGRTFITSLPHPKRRDEGEREVLTALGRLWQAGLDIDWQGFYFYRQERRRRVALPSYPFERRRFWLDPETAKVQKADAESGDGLKPQADPERFAHAPVWRSAHLPTAPPTSERHSDQHSDPADAPSGQAHGGARPWLLVMPEDALTHELASSLRHLGHAVAVAMPTARSGAIDSAGATDSSGATNGSGPVDGIHRIDPQSRDSYRALFESLGGPPSRVAYGLSAAPEHGTGLDALLACVQALASATEGGTDGVHFDLVTDRAWRIQSSDTVEPSSAALWGLLEVMPQELRRWRCRGVDIDRSEDPVDLAEDLADELLADARSTGPRVAWRAGGRWVRDFEPLALATAEGASASSVPEGPWLITGGLGGVGLSLARALVTQGAGDEGAKLQLVLLGRRGLPPRETWDSLLEAPSTEPDLVHKIQAVQGLESAGAEVVTVAADVVDREALAAGLDSARRHVGPIAGAIHAAGIAGGGILATRAAADADAVLRPKVQGLLNLAELLAEDPLHSLVLCSSINAVVGGYGQGDYCAANAFLDAYAQAQTPRLAGHRRAARNSRVAGNGRAAGNGHRSPRVVSLGWDRWRGVGMANVTGGEVHPLLGMRVLETTERQIYRALYAPEDRWVLSEHRIAGRPTIPGASYLEMARGAFAADHDGPVEIRDVAFLAPLAVDEGHRREVLTVLDRQAGENGSGAAANFRILSRPWPPEDGDGKAWTEHCRGRVSTADVEAPEPLDLGALADRLQGRITAEDAAQRSSRGFLVTGRRWQGLESVRQGGDELLADITLAPECATVDRDLSLHPSLLDIAVGYVQLVQEGDYLPLSYECLRTYAPLPSHFASHLVLRGQTEGDTLFCDATLVDPDGRPLAVVEGFAMKRLARDVIADLERQAEEHPTSVGVQGAMAPGGGAAGVTVEEAVLAGVVEPEAAGEVLRRVLTAPRVPAHLVITPRRLSAVADAYGRFDPSRMLADLATLDAPTARHDRPDLGTAYVPPAEGLEGIIAEVWQRYLGIDDIGVHDNFFELGGTSLVGVQVVGELKTRLGREIPTVALFEAPSIKALARHLAPSDEGEKTFTKTRARADAKKAALAKRRKARPARARRRR